MRALYDAHIDQPVLDVAVSFELFDSTGSAASMSANLLMFMLCLPDYAPFRRECHD